MARSLDTLAPDLIVRDANGNTVYRAVLNGIPYDGFRLVDAHVTYAGNVIVTVALTEGEES